MSIKETERTLVPAPEVTRPMTVKELEEAGAVLEKMFSGRLKYFVFIGCPVDNKQGVMFLEEDREGMAEALMHAMGVVVGAKPE